MFESVQCSKNDVWVWSMNDLVNAFLVQCLMFFIRSQNSGVWVQSSIDEHVQVHSMLEKWCSSSFDVRKIMFEFSRFSTDHLIEFEIEFF